MRVWLPHLIGRSGSDSFVENLAAGLQDVGHEVHLQRFSRFMQSVPDVLRLLSRPPTVDVSVSNAAHAFAFAHERIPLVAVVHHWVHEPAFAPFRTKTQAIYHEQILKLFERRSLEAAAAVVAVSEATRRAVKGDFPETEVRVIPNGVDTTFFTPPERSPAGRPGPFRLLFVGNLTLRKGSDLLAPTMHLLGPEFVLEYTSGLRDSGLVRASNAHPLGRLTQQELADSYRNADALFLPSRLEGGPLVALEAMACGLPVIGSNVSAVPEAVVHGKTGLLVDHDPEQFAAAFRSLASDRGLHDRMSRAAREHVVSRFKQETMASRFGALLEEVTG